MTKTQKTLKLSELATVVTELLTSDCPPQEICGVLKNTLDQYYFSEYKTMKKKGKK